MEGVGADAAQTFSGYYGSNPIIGIAILIIGSANLIFGVWGLIGIFRLFRNIWSYL